MVFTDKMTFCNIAASLLLCFSLIGSGYSATVKIRCTDDFTLYVDGVKKADGTNTANAAKTVTVDADAELIAVKCSKNPSSSSTRGGIFLSFKNEYEGEYITDSTWRCGNGYTADWFKPGFDDNIWNYAASTNTNTKTLEGLTPDSNVPSYVNWIWTSSHSLKYGDGTVYCRGYPKIPQSQDSYGRRFVVAFMQNRPNPPSKNLRLLFTTIVPTDVTVYCETPRLASNQNGYVKFDLTIKAGEVKQKDLTPKLRHFDTKIQNLGLRCDATQPVKIIGLNQETYSTDMFLTIPITSLGKPTEENVYYAVAWDKTTFDDARAVVAAGYDNTVIKVLSKVKVNYNGAFKAANSEFSITLQYKYQTVQLSSTYEGFSGTRIKSNKPVAVYSGNEKSSVLGTGSGTSQDHLVEQLQPSRNFGKKFFITPLPTATQKQQGRIEAQLSFYKYIAAEAGTVITVKKFDKSGKSLSSIEYKLNEHGYQDESHPKESHGIVTSNKGIQVAQFATTKGSSAYLGDPWLQMIPPSNLASRDYGLLTPTLAISSSCGCTAKHYVTVIVKKSNAAGIKVNGKAIDRSGEVALTGEDYVYITQEIPYSPTDGVRVTHTDTKVTFTVYFYGYGYLDSYATMGGTRMFPVNLPCVKTSAKTFGDGLDNDCDGLIDEDDCTSSPDPSTKDCALPAPINGGWSAWKKGDTCDGCSASQSVGKRENTRQCNNPLPKFYGLPCSGVSSEKVDCPCTTVHGNWAPWANAPWSGCSATCGDKGTRSRTRTCSDPAPTGYPVGNDCAGSNVQTEKCTLSPCPVHGAWSAWSEEIKCTTNQKNGQKVFTRTCSNPKPAHGGNDCVGSKTKSATHDCSIDGGWSAYGAWTSCDKTCGTGSRSRKRTCTNPKPQYQGKDCSGSATQTGTCNTNPCPIDGKWSAWGAWSSCTKSCGTGQYTHTRTCTNPAPQHNGKDCDSSTLGTSETQDCNTHNCPIDGGWGDWANTTADCSDSKPITGLMTQERKCDNPKPQYNGKDCDGNGTRYISHDCIKTSLGSAYKDLYEFKKETTCKEEKANSQKLTVSECATKCNDDDYCYAFLYDGTTDKPCTLFTACTTTGSTNNEVTFIKKDYNPPNDLNMNAAGAQGGNPDNDEASEAAGAAAQVNVPVAAAVGGAVGGVAALAATALVVMRRRKKKKEEENQPKPKSVEANDMEPVDIEDGEGGVDNPAAQNGDVDW